MSDYEAICAQRDAAIRVLRTVIKLIDRKGYLSHEAQATIREADALITEATRWNGHPNQR